MNPQQQIVSSQPVMERTPEHPFGTPQPWANAGKDCCSPIGACCMSWWCPCIIYAKIQHRLHVDGNLQGYKPFNVNCLAYYCIASAGCSVIPQMLSRSEIRRKYILTGNSCTDYLCGYWCGPCDLSQQYKETEQRERERLLANGGLKIEQVQVQPTKMEQGMMYQPQQMPPQQYYDHTQQHQQQTGFVQSPQSFSQQPTPYVQPQAYPQQQISPVQMAQPLPDQHVNAPVLQK